MEASKPKVLFLQSLFTAHGGAHSVAAWMLEALRSRYDVTVLTWSRPDLARINELFGTSLAYNQATWIYPSALARRMVETIPDDSDLQKLMWLSRLCKRIQSGYDLLLTADSEVDFGRPGIQYVHYPYLFSHYSRLNQYGNLDGWRKIPATLRRVHRPWMSLGGFSFARMRQNLTLANSDWTGNIYKTRYAAKADTLYPPASGQFPAVPWEQRSSEFVSLSRFDPVKNHLRIINILRRVRERRPEIKLRMVGTRTLTAAGTSYFDKVQRAVRENSDWVSLQEGVSRIELSHLLSHAKFGIHLMPEEHFGMAVAEMARSGALPFVHNSGGQVEIAQNEALSFTDDDDAVRRILSVLDAPARLKLLHQQTLQASQRFTPEHFSSELIHKAETWRSRQGASVCA